MDATEAAVHFAKALEFAGVRYAIGGAIAYGFFGAARGTHDVAINIFTAGDDALPALKVLIQAGLSINLDQAVNSATERGDARGVFAGMPVDLFFNSIPAHERASSRTHRVALHGVPISVLAPEDTATFKMLFFRGKDLVDVERLLALMGPRLNRETVRAALVEVVGEQDYRVKKWDELTSALAP